MRNVPNTNEIHAETLTRNERIGLWVTERLGTMFMVYALALIMAAWMIWQGQSRKPFDPFPYVFLLFCSNVIQILLMPLIMVGQNVQARHGELRAEHEYQTTVKAEAEVAAIQAKLDVLIVRLEDAHDKLNAAKVMPDAPQNNVPPQTG